MSNLNLKQQSIDSWTVTHNKTGVLVAWITQLQNRLGKSNQSYQVVIRGEMTREFTVFEGYDSLNEVTACLENYKVGGEA